MYHELHESYKYFEHETVNDSGTDDGDDRLVLSDWQYEKFLALEYFYRPVS